MYSTSHRTVMHIYGNMVGGVIASCIFWGLLQKYKMVCLQSQTYIPIFAKKGGGSK